MSIETQNDMILAHLKAGKSITPLEALSQFGTMRLGARIYDLKQDGHVIDRDMIVVDGHHGPAKVAQYTLIKAAA